MRLKPVISTAAVFADIMLSGGIALGTPTPQLTITENSSTSLTATLTGTSVTVAVAFDGTDRWTLTLSSSLVGTGVYWLEPGDPTEANLVEADPSNTDQLDVFSDITAPPAGAMANGTTANSFFLVSDNGAQQVLDVTFNDNGDVSRVPDATSTLPLLSLSLAGLGMLARRLKA